MAITNLRFCEFNKPVAASIDCDLSPAGSRPVGFRPARSEIVLCVIAINVHKVSDELFCALSRTRVRVRITGEKERAHAHCLAHRIGPRRPRRARFVHPR